MAQKYGFLTFDELQLEIVKDRLESFGGNQTKAAESLQIHVHTIQNTLKKANETAIDENAQIDKIRKQQEKDMALRREGYVRDPETGRSMPSALSPARGIENALLSPRDYSKDVAPTVEPIHKPEVKTQTVETGKPEAKKTKAQKTA
jgi:hypothetical protein